MTAVLIIAWVALGLAIYAHVAIQGLRHDFRKHTHRQSNPVNLRRRFWKP